MRVTEVERARDGEVELKKKREHQYDRERVVRSERQKSCENRRGASKGDSTVRTAEWATIV